MTSTLQQRALELKNQGLSFTEIKDALGLVSRGAAAGYVHRAKMNALHRPTRRPNSFTHQIFFYATPTMNAQLAQMAEEWGCSRSEVLRTLFSCAVEDYLADD